jgi:hypothetical protein
VSQHVYVIQGFISSQAKTAALILVLRVALTLTKTRMATMKHANLAANTHRRKAKLILSL